MTAKTDFFDQEIRQRVRSVEHEVPGKVEQAFNEALQNIEPIRPLTTSIPGKRSLLLRGGLVAAATILLAMVMLIGYMVIQQSNPSSSQVVEAEEVSVQDSYVEGQPASTYVVSPRDSNMTIVWVEKIKN
jgi:hypothetical protein